MLTIIRYFEDLWLEFKYEFYGVVLRDLVKKLDDCIEKQDVEGIKELNETIKKLVLKREEVFVKRLELRGGYYA